MAVVCCRLSSGAVWAIGLRHLGVGGHSRGRSYRLVRYGVLRWRRTTTLSDTEEDLINFICQIPDLTSHRFVDADGELSTKIHEPWEVAERVAKELAPIMDRIRKAAFGAWRACWDWAEDDDDE